MIQMGYFAVIVLGHGQGGTQYAGTEQERCFLQVHVDRPLHVGNNFGWRTPARIGPAADQERRLPHLPPADLDSTERSRTLEEESLAIQRRGRFLSGENYRRRIFANWLRRRYTDVKIWQGQPFHLPTVRGLFRANLTEEDDR